MNYQNWAAQHPPKETRAPQDSFTPKENKVRIKIQNDSGFNLAFYHLDKDIFPNTPCCDWLIAESPHPPTSAGALLELKDSRSHIKRAIDQLEATINNLHHEIDSGLTLRQALIVSSGGRVNIRTHFHSHIAHFKSNYNVTLRQQSNNTAVPFSKLIG